jgi:uncharacterized protein YxeA
MEAIIIAIVTIIGGFLFLNKKSNIDNSQSVLKQKDEILEKEQYSLKRAISDLDAGINAMKKDTTVNKEMTPEQRADLSAKRFK